MIPKIIHYCWFGSNELPVSARKCIDSWKKYFPDYEIKEWNESNFDINCIPYVQEAYKQGKWAFVSDYARFWILYTYGGLYFDTDVEVIAPFEDILERGNFIGTEINHNEICVNPGLGLGCEAGLELFGEMIEYYRGLHFVKNKDNTYSTVVDHTTELMNKHGYDGKKKIENTAGITIYPPEYFSPMNYKTGDLTVTNCTHSIHHYTASWQTPYERFKGKIQRLLGEKMTIKVIGFKKKVLRKK